LFKPLVRCLLLFASRFRRCSGARLSVSERLASSLPPLRKP